MKVLHDGGILDIAHSRPGRILREKNTQQSQLSEFWLKFNGEMLLFILLHYVWRNLRLGELAHTHLYLLLFFR